MNSKKIEEALRLIDKRKFIAHYSTEYWGGIINIMSKNGSAFCRIYWYNNINDEVYLDSLDVNPKYRNKKIGTTLQELREDIGRLFNVKYSCLWVKTDSWMKKWYNKRGYKKYCIYQGDEDGNYIWMRKKL